MLDTEFPPKAVFVSAETPGHAEDIVFDEYKNFVLLEELAFSDVVELLNRMYFACVRSYSLVSGVLEIAGTLDFEMPEYEETKKELKNVLLLVEGGSE